MPVIRKIFAALNIGGKRKKRKKIDDASIYPLF